MNEKRQQLNEMIFAYGEAMRTGNSILIRLAGTATHALVEQLLPDAPDRPTLESFTGSPSKTKTPSP